MNPDLLNKQLQPVLVRSWGGHVLYDLYVLAYWMTPFAVKWVFGFEWAVLLAFVILTRAVTVATKAILEDTSRINIMKQYETGAWNPYEGLPSDQD